MRRPDWWPAVLWPGADEPTAARGDEPSASARDFESTGRGSAAGESAPWPTFVDLLVESLGAGSGAIWRLEGERWSVVAEQRSEGWSNPERDPCPALGHPFTWAVREDLILQVPGDRIADRELGGWVVLVPDARRRRLVELWFSSAPGPSVRGATSAVQSHLRWLGEAVEGIDGIEAEGR